MRTRLGISGLLAGLWLLAACAKDASPAASGGETNWLAICEDTTDCERGSCICGVCTQVCTTADACDGAFEGACVAAGSRIGRACGVASTNVGLCLPNCSVDAACGDGFACRDGVCLTGATAEWLDADTGAQDAAAQDAAVQDAAAQDAAAQDASLLSDAGSDGGPDCQPGLLTPTDCQVATQSFCTWDSARMQVPACRIPFRTLFHAVRCGEYDGVVANGIDSVTTFFYDASGALVGNEGRNPETSSCTSYNPSFTSPPTCEVVTPECSNEGEEPICDCDASTQSLECVCTQFECPSYADARGSIDCQRTDALITLERGCGYQRFDFNGSLTRYGLLYQGMELDLVGAYLADDWRVGTCGILHYTTELPELSECDDHSICSLCDTPLYPRCEP